MTDKLNTLLLVVAAGVAQVGAEAAVAQVDTERMFLAI
jgi:hypothetical protein